MKNKWSLITLGLCASLLSLATCTAAAPQASPSSPSADVNPLVAASRKARADKAQQPNRATKVYTNDDLSSIKAGGVSVVGGAAPPAESGDKAAATEDADKAGAAKAAAPPKDEGYWRARFAEARRKLSDDARELDILQRELNLKEQQYYSDPNQALREQYSRKDVDDMQAKIDAKKADVDKDQQAISDLEDELRKAGGDPGWATDESATPAPVPAQPPSDAEPKQP